MCRSITNANCECSQLTLLDAWLIDAAYWLVLLNVILVTHSPRPACRQFENVKLPLTRASWSSWYCEDTLSEYSVRILGQDTILCKLQVLCDVYAKCFTIMPQLCHSYVTMILWKLANVQLNLCIARLLQVAYLIPNSRSLSPYFFHPILV